MMKKNREIIILVIVFTLALAMYVFTSMQDKPSPEKIGKPLLQSVDVSTNGMELVEYNYLDTVNGRKACFKNNLPDYLYGRLSSKCVDTLSYRSSTFKPKEQYAIYRIYIEDEKNVSPTTHNYVFYIEDKSK